MAESDVDDAVAACGALTPKQQRFVDEYVVDLNGAQAALRAGYSPNRADQTASRLLASPKVAEAVAVAQAAIGERLGRTQDDVAGRLEAVAFTDMTEIAEWGDGQFTLKDSAGLPDAARAAVKKLKVRRRHEITGSKDDPQVWIVENIELELDDRLKALELFGRHIGMWPREAPQVNIDARSITLGSDIIEAVGGVDGLRALAIGPDEIDGDL